MNNNNNIKINTKDFINYLKNIGFPFKNYNALKDYPGTKILNNRFINYFNKKYKKKFLYSHENKNTILNSNSNQLFNNSFKYISNLQNNLLNKNIENYISGGSALKLYSLLYNEKNNDKLFSTKDYDLYLYCNEKKITNKVIIHNIENILNSVVEINKFQNYAFIDLYTLINYENKNEFNEIIEIFLNNGYDLNTYLIKSTNNKEIYEFRFLKIINKELCLRIKLKLLNIESMINEGIYSYTKLTYFYIKKLPNNVFKVFNKYIPVEILIKNKHKSNLEIMKSSIQLYNNIFYIYNLNTLLYNLMHLYYKYDFNTTNITIERKKIEGKNVRDKKRLDLFFKIYCNVLYPNLNNNKINLLLIKLKENEKKFKKNIEEIKDFSMIEKIF
jgi:hypothetical protein